MKNYILLTITIILLLANGCSGEGATDFDTKNTPERIVVISPAIAEMLDRLGLADRIVGIGQFGPWPETLEDLPVVGGYDNPNVEQVIELGTDAVLNVKSQAAMNAHHRLETAGIEVIALDTSTVEGVFESLKLIGKRFNRAEAASEISESIRRELFQISQITDDLSRPRVLFVVGRNPIYVAGPESHVDYLIKLAGGENIAKDAIAPYQQISLEIILERKPEIIIDTSYNHSGSLRGQTAGHWGTWPFLPAVKNNRVYWVDPSQVVIPGIRMANMARLMGKFIHPEIFGNPATEDFLKYRIPDHVTAH